MTFFEDAAKDHEDLQADLFDAHLQVHFGGYEIEGSDEVVLKFPEKFRKYIKKYLDDDDYSASHASVEYILDGVLGDE